MFCPQSLEAATVAPDIEYRVIASQVAGLHGLRAKIWILA